LGTLPIEADIDESVRVHGLASPSSPDNMMNAEATHDGDEKKEKRKRNVCSRSIEWAPIHVGTLEGR
jgi:hypothetical protein